MAVANVSYLYRPTIGQPAMPTMPRRSLILLPALLVGCATTPPQQEQTFQLPNGTTMQIPAPVSADRVPNPVEIVRQAGATPDDGATKGNYSADGYWTAAGKFPSSPENEQVGAYNQFTVNSYPDRTSLEKALANNSTAITDDTHKVLVGIDRPFYAVIIGFGDGTFDVDPAKIAVRIKATLKP